MITDPFIVGLAANTATLLLTLGLNKIKDNTTLSDALSTCCIDIEDEDIRRAVNELLLTGGQEIQAIVNDDIKARIANALIQNIEIKPGLISKDRYDYFTVMINRFFDKLCEQVIKNEQYFRKLTIEYERSIKADTQCIKTIVENNYEVTQDIQTRLAEIKALVSINTALQNKENTATISEDKDKYLSSLYDHTKTCEKHNDNAAVKDITENKYLKEPEATKHRSYAAMLNNLGKVYFEEDNIEKAIEYIKQANAVNANEPKYALNLSNLYTETDNYEEAERILSSISETEDVKLKADIKNVQALIAAFKNDINKSIELLDEALILVPDDDIYAMNKGYYLCRKDEYPEGIKLLRQVYEKNKENKRYLKSLAFCLLQYHMSVSSLRKGSTNDEYSTHYYLKIDDQDPELNITEELKEACILYDKIIGIKGSNIDDKTLLNASICFLQNGDYQRALELNNQINESQSKYYRHNLKNRGIIFVYLKNDVEACKCFKEYAEKYPDEADSHMSLGQAYVHLELYKEALECFRKANELDNTNPYIIASMASTLGKMGCFNASLEKTNIVIGMGLESSIIYYNKGVSEYNLKYYASAKKSFLLSKELNRKEIWEKQLLYFLSECADKLHETDEAISYMGKLLLIEPMDNELNFKHAILLFNKGRYSDSEEVCKKVLSAKLTEKLRIKIIKLLEDIQGKTNKIIIPLGNRFIIIRK